MNEDRAGARGKEEPDRAKGVEGRGAAKGPEVRGNGRMTTDQGGAREGERARWRSQDDGPK